MLDTCMEEVRRTAAHLLVCRLVDGTKVRKRCL